MVRSEGLEPSLLLQNSDLNAARLPIPPRPQAPAGCGAYSVGDLACEADFDRLVEPWDKPR